MVAGDRGRREGAVAEADFARIAVGEDVDSTDAGAAFEVLGDLLHTVAVGGEEDDFGVRLGGVGKRLGVGDAGVDEDDVGHLGCGLG